MQENDEDGRDTGTSIHAGGDVIGVNVNRRQKHHR